MTLEQEIEDYFVKQCEAAGAEVRKVKWIGRRAATDRVVMGLTPATIWVELKQPGAKPKPHQVREHRRMREHKQTVYVIDSFEAVDAFISLSKE